MKTYKKPESIRPVLPASGCPPTGLVPPWTDPCTKTGRSKSLLLGLEDPERIENRLDAGHFMRAEQIGLAQRGQHGEEGFRTAHFLAEILEGMRQGVADREAERAQQECV